MRPGAIATVTAAVLAAAAAPLAACWSERAPDRPRMTSTPVPGTLWITPAQPWRASWPSSHLAIAGPTALLASSERIMRFDLERGAVVRERRIEGLSIEQLVAAPGGGWILVGRREGRAAIATVDPITLEPNVVATGDRTVTSSIYSRETRAVVVDEGIAIAVEGLPLAIYAPQTLEVRRVVDPGRTWTAAGGGGKTLYVTSSTPNSGLQRFDLATGASEKLDKKSYHGATATRVVTLSREQGRWGYDVLAGDKKTRIGTGESHAVLDRAGERIAIQDGASIHVHALADGKRLRSFDLGPSGLSRVGGMAFDRGRLAVTVGPVVRVIDLTTGAITPAGDPPYGWSSLAVGAGGEVLAVGMHAVRIADGKLAASSRIGFDDAATVAPHQIARYGVIRKPDEKRLEVFEVGARAPAGAWKTEEDTIQGAWLGRAGGVVIDTSGIHGQRVLLQGGPGGSLRQLTPLNFHAMVDDLDVDGGHALVSIESTVHVVRLRDAALLHSLPTPRCEKYAHAELEHGGDRLVLADGEDIAVYRRSTGESIGAAKLPDQVNSFAFVPGRGEVLVADDDAILLWEPATGALRRFAGLAGLAEAEISPDARHLALAFFDGRIALVDLDVLRAAMKPDRPLPSAGAIPQAKCESGEPFALDPDHLPEEFDVPDDPDGGDIDGP